MMLGVDPALASCGWAVVTPRTGKVIACGVIVTEHDGTIGKSTDRARRSATVGRELAAVLALHDCTAIAAEAMLGHGTVGAVVPQTLCWGALTMLAVASGASLVEVTAKKWQHAVSPAVGRIRYASVETALAAFIGHPLELIPKGLRTHAIDAAGVGMAAELRPHLVKRIVPRGVTQTGAA